ncbi:hypothetical protein F1C16_05275 [Hymenobacter sp. NBH84]|uniref:phage integrase SAM-like domain-containing protein n=1 Tax=Hymenobacter sp. NBH84 TaxID=2596915 RepID=UPI00162524ED|nr:phage integrase SAM-like domain-containing protein [Hymenobacter sp. NBH84]QNE39007.1 hypothetical protein F1C16_05275 [Hymenobacter sp. NBH84]
MNYTVALRLKGPTNKKGEISIRLRYTYQQKQYWKSTGLSVQPDLWLEKAESISKSHPDAYRLNNQLKFQKNMLELGANSANDKADWELVQKWFTWWVEAETTAALDDVSQEAREDREAKERQETVEYQREVAERSAKIIDLNTDRKEEQEFRKLLDEYPNTFLTSGKLYRQQIASWKNYLLRFAEEKKFPLTFANMNMDFYKQYGDWVLHENNNYDNYFGTCIKRLKTFLIKCESDDIYVNPKFRKFKVLQEEKEIIYLTVGELELVWNYKPENPTMQKYIDLCVFENLTGLRVSDIMKSKFRVDNGVLKGINKKNVTTYFIPLAIDPRIELLLEKYDYNMAIAQEQHYNKYIKVILKEVFEKHGINQNTIHITRYKWKQPYYFEFKKHELITNHSARRGFISNMYNVHKYSVEDIKAMLGTKSNEIMKYLKLEESTIIEKAEAKAKERTVQ